uniref:Uncharacterized protein n=1 Tax=Spongospora subterranea TaxID=70186 RepID=A0A0H5RF78_9EUKA|eukprot:CRZ12845.1 hypothetical protein [Spongospora subterranea]
MVIQQTYVIPDFFCRRSRLAVAFVFFFMKIMSLRPSLIIITVFATLVSAHDFFDDDIGEDMDIFAHEEDTGHDEDFHHGEEYGDGAKDRVAVTAATVVTTTSSGLASHTGESNEHYDRSHDHIVSDKIAAATANDNLVSNDPNMLGLVPGNPGVPAPVPLPTVTPPDLTNHALPQHAVWTGLHGMPPT